MDRGEQPLLPAVRTAPDDTSTFARGFSCKFRIGQGQAAAVLGTRFAGRG